MTEEKDTLTKRISELEVHNYLYMHCIARLASSPGPFPVIMKLKAWEIECSGVHASFSMYVYNCTWYYLYACQAKLEAVGKKGSSLEEDKQQLQTEYDAAKRQLEELQERHSKVHLQYRKIFTVKL